MSVVRSAFGGFISGFSLVNLCLRILGRLEPWIDQSWIQDFDLPNGIVLILGAFSVLYLVYAAALQARLTDSQRQHG